MLPALAKFATTFAKGAVARNPAGLIVRAGRVAFIGSAGFLTVATFTAWRNQEGKRGFLETVSSGSWTPEKAFKPLSLDQLRTPAREGGTRTAGINGDSQVEQFNEQRYNRRQRAAARIAQHFGVTVSSAGRTEASNAAANGVPTSLHLFSNGALAFDFGGAIMGERRLYAWASNRPDLFQEVIYHDAGSGLHVHIAFKPFVTSVDHFASSDDVQIGGSR